MVDDGSTDRTAEIAADYPGVKLVSQQRQGVSVARNVGAGAATGEYIHFMDVDDLINIDFYERMADATGATEADMVFCSFDCEMWPWESLMFTERIVCVEAEDKYAVTETKNLGYCWRYMCRKSFLEEHGLEFTAGRLHEDLTFTVQAVFHAARIVTVPGAIYYYRKREGSALNSADSERAHRMHEHWKESIEFRDDFLKQHGLKPALEREDPEFRYKIFGIPMLRKKIYPNSGKTKWYFLGMRIVQKTHINPTDRS